ncbi:WecB/TagA/CpsF family glycosyltransferase [Paucihalobacter sp.]|uniref:WecB/TagA/CpsF family glycosyltransferase n=1 Tax=Paucihalobacter sp. TaxID=2850405 RepID=UPI003D161C7C
MKDNSYFNVKLEFDCDKVDQIIHDAIINNGKGYVCSIDGNVLSVANTNPEFNTIVNNSLVNICDGNSIAMLATLIHKRKFKTYIGADLFLKYIKMAKYRSFFLGNTSEVLQGLKSNLSKYDSNIGNMRFETLPFKSVEDFNYSEIAKMINEDNPDIIWVSLGAPKQENFMSKLQPYLNRGVMFGFGAIFNFNSGVNNERAPKVFLKLKLEWVYRLFKEPKKQFQKFKMYTKVLPSLIYNEINIK